MNDHFKSITLKATGADRLTESEVIQSLWSGYGKIVRCGLEGSPFDSVVVKHVHWPDAKNHPRGWNTGRSHERKVKSYQVETAWYDQYASRCDANCRIPECLALETHGDEVFMVLEDLDAVGFPERRRTVSDPEIKACLSWLAYFHATFMQEKPVNLWEIGTYWHLETRPDELNELDDEALKNAASAMDQKLKDSPFQTLVHGDAKLANFCFSKTGRVAAVDFQYVGGGCGMKDVAYLISSCLCEDECERQEKNLLNFYFQTLEAALNQQGKDIDFQALQTDWRALYPVAWTDFYRFLQGWSPGHWKIHRYSNRLAREVLEQLDR
jgi:aminoglycoside phosphotransferase (APT) family kinase protein